MDKDKHTNHAAEQETESSWDFERRRIAFIQKRSEKEREYLSEIPLSEKGLLDFMRKELIKAYFIPPYRLRVEIKS